VNTFKGKGLGILFGQFFFFNHSLRWILMGPPNHTFNLTSQSLLLHCTFLNPNDVAHILLCCAQTKALYLLTYAHEISILL